MTDTQQSTSTSFSISLSLPSTTRRQSKLTKKQKKASAFRDKSSRSKTKNKTDPKDEQEVEMEDLYVLNVEKPSGTCYASGSLQMGNEEGQSPKRTESREPTHPNSKGPADATSLAQQETYNQSRQQKSHQKRQQIGAVRVEQHNGDQDKKRIKKRKRANLDAVDEELGMDGKPEGGKTQEKGRGKKQKIEETKCGVDSAEGEGEGEGEEMSEEEGGGEKEKEKGKEKGKEKQRFILFIGWSVLIQTSWYSRGSQEISNIPLQWTLLRRISLHVVRRFFAPVWLSLILILIHRSTARSTTSYSENVLKWENHDQIKRLRLPRILEQNLTPTST